MEGKSGLAASTSGDGPVQQAGAPETSSPAAGEGHAAVDPVMAYVEKLEAWRQGKLDRFDSDEAYRDARLMKHGTRTGFEEFLDRSIENQVKKSLTLPAAGGGAAAGKKEKKSKKQKQNATPAQGDSGPRGIGDGGSGGGEGGAPMTTEAAMKTLSAFERMAQALRKGVLGTVAASSSAPPPPPVSEAQKQQAADARWAAAMERMDAETRALWDFLENREADRAEIKRRFLLSLETGVPAMFQGRQQGSSLTASDQDNILHGMLRAAADEAKGTGDGLDDGETNVLRKFQTPEENAAVLREVAAREAAERAHAAAEEERRAAAAVDEAQPRAEAEATVATTTTTPSATTATAVGGQAPAAAARGGSGAAGSAPGKEPTQ